MKLILAQGNLDMKINYENTAPIESIEIDQPLKGTIAGKTIVLKEENDDKVVLYLQIKGLRTLTYKFDLKRAIQIRDSFTLLIEQIKEYNN